MSGEGPRNPVAEREDDFGVEEEGLLLMGEEIMESSLRRPPALERLARFGVWGNRKERGEGSGERGLPAWEMGEGVVVFDELVVGEGKGD